MSTLPARMVEVDSGERSISLESLLLHSESIPIEMFGDPTQITIQRAITYLKSVGGGSIRIPANETYNLLIIRVVWGRDRLSSTDMITHYEYMNWRPPNNLRDSSNNTTGEYRPYSTEPWQIGDIIHNSDIAQSDEKSVKWFCISSGTDELPAGTWKPISLTGSTGAGVSYDASREKITIITSSN